MAFVSFDSAENIGIGTDGFADDGAGSNESSLVDNNTGTSASAEIRAGMVCYKAIIDLGFPVANLDNSNLSIRVFDGTFMTAAGLCVMHPYIDGNSVHASVSQTTVCNDNNAYDEFLMNSAWVDELVDVGTDQIAVRFFASGSGRGRFNELQIEFSEAGGPKTASGGGTMGAVQAAGAAVVHRAASGAATLAPVEAAGTAVVHRAASGGATIAAIIAVGTAVIPVVAGGGASIAPVEAAGTATVIPAAGGVDVDVYPLRPTLEPVQPGSSVVFVDDGVDYIKVGQPPTFEVLEELTIWSWISLDGTGFRAGRIFSAGDNELELQINGTSGLNHSRIDFVVSRATTDVGAFTVDQDIVPVDDSWQFVAVTWKLGEIPILYLGDLDEPAAIATLGVNNAGAGAVNYGGGDFAIGNRANDPIRSFGGRIGAVGFINRAIDQTELQRLQFGPQLTPETIGLWFPGIDDQFGFTRDWSRTGAHGSLVGTALTLGDPLPLSVYPEIHHRPILIERETVAAQTDAYPLRTVPWDQQPPQEMPLDRSNRFGQHCVGMIIPGWSAAGQDDSTTRTDMVPIIGTPFSFDTAESGTPTSGSMFTEQGDYLGRPAVVLTQSGIGLDGADGYKLHDATASLGPLAGETQFTVIGIYKPEVNGVPVDGSDPRLFAKDLGVLEADSDLMIGIKDAGAQVNSVPRTRVRLGGTTLTVLPADTAANAIQNDAWNLIASTVRGNEVKVHGLREDGGYATATDTGTGVYDPRTTTGMACFGGGGTDANQYIGQLLGVWFFDVSFDDLATLQDFFENPWQIFEPRRDVLLIESVADVGKTASGAASIPAVEAAGTATVHRAASGSPSIAPVEAAGTAIVHRAASGAASIPAVEAAGTAVVHRAASGSAEIAPVEAAGTALVRKQASGTPSITPVIASGSALVHRAASGAATILPIEAAGTATVHRAASGDATITAIEASGTALVRKQASGAATIPSIEAAGTALVHRSASGAATLAPVEAAGVAAVGGVVVASGGAILAPITASGAAIVHRAASGAATLQTIAASGAATVHRAASGGATLAPVEASGTALVKEVHTASGSPELAPVTASGAAQVIRKASGAATLTPVLASGAATVGIKQASGAATLAPIEASGAALVHRAAFGSATLAPITASGTAIVRKTAAGAADIPIVQASGAALIHRVASGAALLPAITASGTAIVGGVPIFDTVELTGYFITSTFNGYHLTNITFNAYVLDSNITGRV